MSDDRLDSRSRVGQRIQIDRSAQQAPRLQRRVVYEVLEVKADGLVLAAERAAQLPANIEETVERRIVVIGEQPRDEPPDLEEKDVRELGRDDLDPFILGDVQPVLIQLLREMLDKNDLKKVKILK